jgi:hypothetical protein
MIFFFESANSYIKKKAQDVQYNRIKQHEPEKQGKERAKGQHGYKQHKLQTHSANTLILKADCWFCFPFIKEVGSA